MLRVSYDFAGFNQFAAALLAGGTLHYLGYVDRHRSGVVWGWACCPSSPESRATVRVFHNTNRIGTVLADEFRRDLAEAGIGDKSGCYMFRFSIPGNLRDLDLLELRFLLDDGHELTGSPLRIVEPTGNSYRLMDASEPSKLSESLTVLTDLAETPNLPVNGGLAFLNANNSRPGPKTVIVVGHARSGTSMVARALHVAGLPMWLRSYSKGNYEDKDFADVFQDATANPQLNTDRVDRMIEDRNREYSSWGFKVPAAMDSLPYLLRRTRNPHIILVFRDLLATCLREHLAVDMDPWEACESILSYQAKMVTLLRNTDVPCFLVSYEKSILNAHFFCKQLGEFVGLTGSSMWMQEAVGQINPNQRDYLERVEQGREELGLSSLKYEASCIR